MSETTASDATPLPSAGASEGRREASVVGVIAEPPVAEAGEPPAGNDVTVDIEVDEISASPAPAPAGFQAILQHANLHNLLQIESLSRTTGVFLVASRGRRGYLHLSNGELIHAESGALSGENAAAEILSWGEGEFKSCARPLAGTVTIESSLPHLLLRLARDRDEAAQNSNAREPQEPSTPDARGLPAGPSISGAPRPHAESSARRPPPLRRTAEDEKATEPSDASPAGDEQRRPGSTPPRSNRLPPPLPPRTGRDPASVAEVLISATGELIQGRGIGPDEFAARVAYAARLADLIGRAIRSGTPQSLELKGRGTQTTVKWQPDGSLAASLELVQSPKSR